MIQPIVKVKSLLSEEIVTLFGNDVIDNAYDEAMKYVLGILNSQSILKSIVDAGLTGFLSKKWTTSTNTEWASNGFMKNRLMLKVERMILDSDGNTTSDYAEAKEVNFLNKEKFTNSNSIYYENNKYKPVWYTDTDNKLQILPSDVVSESEQDAKGRIYYITLPEMGVTESVLHSTFDLAGKTFSTLTQNEEDIIFIGIPHDARELVYIQMALNLVQNYLSDFVYEEEDGEMVNLLNNHLQALSLSKKENLEFVTSRYGKEK